MSLELYTLLKKEVHIYLKPGILVPQSSIVTYIWNHSHRRNTLERCSQRTKKTLNTEYQKIWKSSIEKVLWGDNCTKHSSTVIGKFNSKLIFYKLIPYLVDRCICPAPCRSSQTFEKNVLSWGLARIGSVLFIHQVAVYPPCRCNAHARECTLPLFVAYLRKSPWFRVAGKVGWKSPCPLDKVLTHKNLIYY